MRIAALLLAFMVTGMAFGAENLLKNPSFEEVGEAPDRAAYWNRWGDWMNREDSWTPTRSGKAMIGYHHWQIAGKDNSGLWQDAPAKKGQRYTFSIYVTRDEQKDAKAPREVEIALEATVDGGQMTIVTKKVPGSEIAIAPQWSKLQVTGMAAGETIRALVRITPSEEGPRGGSIKMDDAEVVVAR